MRFEETLNEERNVDPYKVVQDIYDSSFPYIKEYLKNFRAVPTDGMMWSGRNGSRIYDVKRIRNDRYPKDTPEHIHNYFDDQFESVWNIRYRSNSIFTTGRITDADSYGDNVYAIFPIGSNYKFIYSPYISDLYSEMVDSGDNSHFGMDVGELAEMMQEGGDFGEIDDIWEIAREEAAEQFEDNNSRDDYEEEDEDGFLEFDEDKWTDDLDNYMEENAPEIADRLIWEKAEELVDTAEETVSYEIGRYKENDLKGAINSNHEIMLTGNSYAMVRRDYVPYIMRYMEVNKSRKPTPERWVEAMKNFDPKKYRNFDPKRLEKSMKRYINSGLLDMMGDLKKP